MNSFKRANDRQSKFVWNEIWKGLLSPGTILTLYLLSRGVRRIFKRDGRGVGAKRRLRGYCGRGPGAQPLENV